MVSASQNAPGEPSKTKVKVDKKHQTETKPNKKIETECKTLSMIVILMHWNNPINFLYYYEYLCYGKQHFLSKIILEKLIRVNTETCK